MLSTFIGAFFGFFFWIINARLFTVEQVGLATTVISLVSLFNIISSLGLNVGLIRFLPKSSTKNDDINSSFTLNAIVSLIIVIVFIFNIETFSPKLSFLKTNYVFIISFLLFVMFSSINSLLESVFIAYRSAKYVLVKNTILNVGKLFFPLLLISFGAYGIFSSVGIATAISTVFSIVILSRVFNYRAKIHINSGVIRKYASYSFKNYLSSFLNLLPPMLLPIIITNKFGPKESAYFYVAFMIASLVFTVPIAVTQSMFAEGSHDETQVSNHAKKSIVIIFGILIPLIIIFSLFGNYILLAFGKRYSEEAFMLLRLLIASSLITSTNYIIGTVLKIFNRVNFLIFGNLIGSGIIIYYAYSDFSHNLLNVGLGWIIGQLVITVIYGFGFYYFKNENRKTLANKTH